MRIAFVCLILCLLLSGGIRAEWDVQRLRKEISASEQSLQDSKSEFVQEYLKEAQRYYHLRNFNASITAIKKGLHLDSKNRNLLVLWGADLIELGAYDKAKRVLKRLVSLYPKCYAGWRYLYQCYLKTSDLNGQKIALEKLYTLAKSDEEKKNYFERLVDLLGEISGLDEQCTVLKKMYALARNNREREDYFKQLVEVLQISQQRQGCTDIVRGFVITQLKRLCNINLEGEVGKYNINKMVVILNQIEEVKKNIPDIRDYYADFISELYDTMYLFDLGYKAIALERLRDLLSQKCPALSS